MRRLKNAKRLTYLVFSVITAYLCISLCVTSRAEYNKNEKKSEIGDGVNITDDAETAANGTIIDDAETMENVDFEVQYIRTDGSGFPDTGGYPLVLASVIRSADELAEYYENNKDGFDLERKENPGQYSTIGFLDACDRYDSEFFSDHALVIAVIEERSGSVRHNVDTVKSDVNGNLFMSISPVGDAITDDIAQWHIMVSVAKDSAPNGEEDVTAIYRMRDN